MSAENSATTPRPLGEISHQPATFDRFMDRHQKNLILLAVLLVIAIVAYIIYRGLQQSHEHTAGAALTQADDLPALQKIIKEYPKTAAAGSAGILLSEKQWTEGQQDAAIATLKDFLANHKDHPAAATARASLGSKLASQGKTGDAEKVFQELADSDSARFLAPFALISLGDLAKASGDLAKAETFYQRAQNEFPDSKSFATTATLRISLLKAKPPAEIEPPPAPPEAAPAGAAAPVSPAPAPLAPDPVPAPEETPAPAPQP